jgi:hypothetical protein
VNILEFNGSDRNRWERPDLLTDATRGVVSFPDNYRSS